ncbi:hypothetical protein MJ585_23405 [Klebsiella pneumoniae]|nr:hypothetical protein MJ585_23405 [Klebsiella pneumoniae]
MAYSRFPNFRKGLKSLANAIAVAKVSPSPAAVTPERRSTCSGIADKISSSTGGAFLEFVEGKVLPAVAMLEERAKR